MPNKIRIDLRDLYLWNAYSWNYSGRPNNRYFTTTDYSSGVRRTLKLHRLIIGAPEGICVDHIDGDTTNNSRRNLRLATHTQNNQNARKRKDGSSKWKGVYRVFNTTPKIWGTHIRVNKKRIFLGCYEFPEDAAMVYNEAALQYFGEFAYLNEAK